EHAAIAAVRRRALAHRPRDAQRPARRDDARAPRGRADPRERAGHGAPRRRRARRARGAPGVSWLSARRPRAVYLGSGPRRGAQPRRDLRVPVRGRRPRNVREVTMATLHLRDEQATITDPDAIAARLAEIGIQYERWAADSPLPDGASADAVLAAYAPQ